MKKFLASVLGLMMVFAPLSGCSFLNGGVNSGSSSINSVDSNSGNSSSNSSSSNDSSAETPTKKLSRYVATEYDVDEIVNANETSAGSVYAWSREVFTRSGGNNDMPTNNAVIHSPWHTLKINGKEVPVYSARAAKGVHSFAWVDVKDSPEEFLLKVELTLNQNFAKCVVLPESREVEADIEGDTVTTYLSEYASYTYTFADEETDAITDPTFAPLTLMVAKEAEMEIPDDYDVVEIEPGYHSDTELVFTEENTVYVMKEGFHDITEIRVPSNSILYIERGAYLQATERGSDATGWNRKTPIHFDDISNSKLISRGLLDCGKLLGGDGKHKHVFNTGRSSNIYIEGLTIINANTWTMCIYNSDNVTLEKNLLISYRTYSDGIMMSECRNSVGRYNFVRTGDDSIEFKGTGWWGKTEGYGCVYEYNDIWTDKGAGYCLTWENTCEMYDMVFRNNTIGFAQPTWTYRNTAIDILLGVNGNVAWYDVTFENIEIYHVYCPNVMQIYVRDGGGLVDNILFKNIKVKSVSSGTCAFRLAKTSTGGDISNIKIKNAVIAGVKLEESHKGNRAYIDNDAGSLIDQLTIVK